MSENEHIEFLEIKGFCPICEKNTVFRAKKGSWLRATLNCLTCEGGSVPRERALAYVLGREYPNWRELHIHECSPGNRGLSVKLKDQCKHYIPTHFFPDEKLGSEVNGWRNENLESTTFGDGQFDIFISQDVLEHVYNPGKCFADIHRTLKQGGAFISTFPIRKNQIDSHLPRIKINQDGSILHLKEPEYHGNPISNDDALVTFDYGYAIHQMIPLWAAFDVEISRFYDKRQGILGEYTEVIICKKQLGQNYEGRNL
jgi:SAM-dependent methyltransferase